MLGIDYLNLHDRLPQSTLRHPASHIRKLYIKGVGLELDDYKDNMGLAERESYLFGRQNYAKLMMNQVKWLLYWAKGLREFTWESRDIPDREIMRRLGALNYRLGGGLLSEVHLFQLSFATSALQYNLNTHFEGIYPMLATWEAEVRNNADVVILQNMVVRLPRLKTLSISWPQAQGEPFLFPLPIPPIRGADGEKLPLTTYPLTELQLSNTFFANNSCNEFWKRIGFPELDFLKLHRCKNIISFFRDARPFTNMTELHIYRCTVDDKTLKEMFGSMRGCALESLEIYPNHGFAIDLPTHLVPFAQSLKNLCCWDGGCWSHHQVNSAWDKLKLETYSYSVNDGYNLNAWFLTRPIAHSTTLEKLVFCTFKHSVALLGPGTITEELKKLTLEMLPILKTRKSGFYVQWQIVKCRAQGVKEEVYRTIRHRGQLGYDERMYLSFYTKIETERGCLGLSWVAMHGVDMDETFSRWELMG